MQVCVYGVQLSKSSIVLTKLQWLRAAGTVPAVFQHRSAVPSRRAAVPPLSQTNFYYKAEDKVLQPSKHQLKVVW